MMPFARNYKIVGRGGRFVGQIERHSTITVSLNEHGGFAVADTRAIGGGVRGIHPPFNGELCLRGFHKTTSCSDRSTACA